MPKRLLVVDDNRNITKTVSVAAASLDFSSCQCNDPMAALDAFIEFQPDVVVLDMCMPEKDGLEVLEEILLTGTSAKIILTSGYTSAYLRLAETIAAFHDHRNIAFLQKPFRRDALIRELTADEA